MERPRLNQMRSLKSLSNEARHLDRNEDVFHKIAIANLESSLRRAERYWEQKYKAPLKDFHDHTEEELYIIMLEDFYEKNPTEIERFKDSLTVDHEWAGETDSEYEDDIRKRLMKVSRKVDLSEYRDDSDSDMNLMAELRRKLPSSGDEVDEDFSILGK